MSSVFTGDVEVQLRIYPSSIEIVKLSPDENHTIPMMSEGFGDGLPPKYISLILGIKSESQRLTFKFDEQTFSRFERICHKANLLQSECDALTNGSRDFDFQAYESFSDQWASAMDEVFTILFPEIKT